MAKKKAKWLEESTLSIAEAIVAALSTEEVTDKEITKALKGAQEIQERSITDEAEPTVTTLISKVQELAAQIDNIAGQAATVYQADLEAAGAAEPTATDSVDEDNEDEVAPTADKKKKKKKKADKAPVEDSEGEDSEVDYEALSKKALRDLAKEDGIKTNKKMDKDELISLLNNN